MTKIINLTPHAINLMAEDDSIIATFASQGVARAASSRVAIDTIDVNGCAISINRTSFGAVENLPAEQDNTLYIVSALTAKAAPSRTDLIAPDDTVRDDAGRIIGCHAFAKLN